MDRDLARIVVSTTVRCAREVGDLVALISLNDSSTETDALKNDLAKPVYDLMEIAVKLCDADPLLKTEVETLRSKYHRYI